MTPQERAECGRLAESLAAPTGWGNSVLEEMLESESDAALILAALREAAEGSAAAAPDDYFAACIPAGYRPSRVGKHTARHPVTIRQALGETAETLAADVIAWLVWDVARLLGERQQMLCEIAEAPAAATEPAVPVSELRRALGMRPPPDDSPWTRRQAEACRINELWRLIAEAEGRGRG